MASYRLELLETASGARRRCEVEARLDGSDRLLTLRPGLEVREFRGYDFEDALQQLRRSIEKDGGLLLCNRFRVDAFTSSMLRQASDGLTCYLVQPGRPVGGRSTPLVACLDPAPAALVVSEEAARRHVEQWQRSFDRPLARLRLRLLRPWTGRRRRLVAPRGPSPRRGRR